MFSRPRLPMPCTQAHPSRLPVAIHGAPVVSPPSHPSRLPVPNHGAPVLTAGALNAGAPVSTAGAHRQRNTKRNTLWQLKEGPHTARSQFLPWNCDHHFAATASAV
jgi:hypothetical protein